MEYQERMDIHRPPSEVFRFLSSIHDLPAYLPAIKEIHLEEADHVWAVAEMAGANVELSGFFRVDEENSHIEWGSDGTPDYHGWLDVRDAPGGTDLWVHLLMAGDCENPEVRVALHNVMENIRRVVEQQGGGGIIGEERAA